MRNHGPGRDDRLLDLLVDGELSDSERRELLASLDAAPDGWRRCAMAFLEAQSWKRDFREILPVREEKPQRLPVSAVDRHDPRSAARRDFEWGRLGTALAIAASFLIALGIGTQIPTFWREQPSGGLQPLEPAGLARHERHVPSRSLPASPYSPEPTRDPWQMVTLANAGSGAPVRLPAREGDRWDERCWKHVPMLPEELSEALQRAGHEVRQSRQFLPMLLEDGRQLVVPVDQVDVRYHPVADYQ